MDREQDRQQQSRWRPTRRQLLWVGGITALAFSIIVICGYLFGWNWTGLPRRTLWDWLSLLIVPAVLALGGYLFTRSENQRTLQSTQRQRDLDRELATKQTETDRELADQRRQDDTLQAYLDGMSQLLTDKELPLHTAQSGDSLSTVARARTLTVLGRLDSSRKRSVLQFLYESRLIEQEQALLNEENLVERRRNIISLQQANLCKANLRGASLSEADLNGADLSYADLREANLRGAGLRGADLSDADLSDADVREADLREAVLSGVDLSEADLSKADLSYADLKGAKQFEADLREAKLFEADLRGASLSGAGLSGADLRATDLRGVDLSYAGLRGADLRRALLRGAELSEVDLSEADLSYVKGVTKDQISAAISLEGATMPNGQKYEDWLNDKESR